WPRICSCEPLDPDTATKVGPGTIAAISANPCTCVFSISLPDNALTATDTFCIDSSRLVAVTTTSSSGPVELGVSCADDNCGIKRINVLEIADVAKRLPAIVHIRQSR